MSSVHPSRPSRLVLPLLLGGTLLGLAGTDLILPAVPTLPAALAGTAAEAQLVLAAFVAGAGLGLLLWGELGARLDQRRLLTLSLALYAVVSGAAVLAPSLPALIALRFLQGAAGAAAAVFAPGFIRALYDERGAMRALALLGSVESLVPALAPIAGASLASAFDWRASFAVIAGLALLLAVATRARRDRLPLLAPRPPGGGYRTLLRRGAFLRYALSQACTLGGLLVFVFGAPAVIVGSLGGDLMDFVQLQVGGIAFFILGASLATRLAGRCGAERMILAGSLLSAAGALAMLGLGLAGGAAPGWLLPPAIAMNLGLGLRGPPGFLRAVQAAEGDDARGAALVVLAILLVAALGTAAVAPFIEQGLTPLALASAAISCASVACLRLRPVRPRPC